MITTHYFAVPNLAEYKRLYCQFNSIRPVTPREKGRVCLADDFPTFSELTKSSLLEGMKVLICPRKPRVVRPEDVARDVLDKNRFLSLALRGLPILQVLNESGGPQAGHRLLFRKQGFFCAVLAAVGKRKTAGAKFFIDLLLKNFKGTTSPLARLSIYMQDLVNTSSRPKAVVVANAAIRCFNAHYRGDVLTTMPTGLDLDLEKVV